MRRLFGPLAPIALVVVMAIAAVAPAAVIPFDAQGFAEAQNADKSIVVMVHAPW